MGLGGRGRLWAGMRREVDDLLNQRRAGRVDRVVAWTFNDAAELAWLMARGVDAVLTDDIALMKRLRDDVLERTVTGESESVAPA